MAVTDELSTSAEAAPAANTSQQPLDSPVCDFLPPQRSWSDNGYLWLTGYSNRLIEFTDDQVQDLPMHTSTHHALLGFLIHLFRAYLKPLGGVVPFAALRVRIRAGQFREPHLLLALDRSDPGYRDRYWLGANLVVEWSPRTIPSAT